MRTIDADAFKARLHGCVIILPNGEKCMADRAIETQGTIEAEPVRHGRWLNRKRNGYAVLVCSECEREKEVYTRTAYCPKCGARMDGGAENG